MKISLITTIRNEENNLSVLLDSILSQTRLPDEVVIIDGGSTDNTIKILESYINTFKEKNINYIFDKMDKCNIAEGRNIAIQLSTGNIIAVTDGGCRLDKNWLKNISEPLIAETADFVGGFFKPIAKSNLQKALASITTAKKPVKNFLPSSRSVAFTRKLWKDVGGYPKWLRWGEDTHFNELCISNGARYEVRDDAIAYWEVRQNLSQVMKQYYRYALGDGNTKKIKISILATAVYLLFATLCFAFINIVIGLLLILFFPFIFILRHLQTIKLSTFIFAYMLIYFIHISRIPGYIIGLLKPGTRK